MKFFTLVLGCSLHSFWSVVFSGQTGQVLERAGLGFYSQEKTTLETSVEGEQIDMFDFKQINQNKMVRRFEEIRKDEIKKSRFEKP